MGKAAAAAATSVVAGMMTFVGLSNVVPLAWAEGVALILTGSALLGASFVLERKPARAAQAESAIAPAHRAQET